jgi:hypothetical protein
MSIKRKARPPVVRKVSSGNDRFTPMTPEDERQLEDDRAWFKARPGTDVRVRPPFPGEDFDGRLAWPAELVVVRKVTPGFRVRYPLARYGFYNAKSLH